MRCSNRGFTLIELMIVVAIIAIIAAIAIPNLVRSRIVANQNNAGASLRQLVNQESIWRQNDSDQNGMQDNWTRDVAGLHCVHDGSDRALAMIDVMFARADKAPAAAYAELAGVSAARQGYFFQTMTTDQDGNPYINATSPVPTAKNAAAGASTNPTRFGFTAFPAVYGNDGAQIFIVGEDGTVWQKDTGVAAPQLDRKVAAPEAAVSGWARYGG